MGMAKKEIFNSQSIFFCQLDVIKQLFFCLLSISRQSLSFFLGGGTNLFSIFFPRILFFSFCCPFLQPVLLPTLLSFLCVEFWLAFQEKGKE